MHSANTVEYIPSSFLCLFYCAILCSNFRTLHFSISRNTASIQETLDNLLISRLYCTQLLMSSYLMEHIFANNTNTAPMVLILMFCFHLSFYNILSHEYFDCTLTVRCQCRYSLDLLSGSQAH